MVLFERLIRIAPTLFMGLVIVGATKGTLAGAETGPVTTGPAEIELRKSFRSVRHAGRRFSPTVKNRNVPGDDRSVADGAGGHLPTQLGAVSAALGEQLQSSGILHLPDVDGADVVLRGSITPILMTAAGRHLIIDPGRTIDPRVMAGLSRRWPGFAVVQPPAGANLRDVIGGILDAAGYDSVLRGAPLIFGRGISIRVTPDFVVLRSDDDLLTGETRAISVLDPADALPSELRELAGDHRVRIVEMTPDGSPVGVDRSPWRDPAGQVTTMETARLAPVIEEISSALGFFVEHRVPYQTTAGEPDLSADLRISLDKKAAYVFEQPDPRSWEIPTGHGDAAIILDSAANLPGAIGALLKHFNVSAVGPLVEFFREPPPGSARRFVISAQGWLIESGNRRLLITGAGVPQLVRLYLTREGIDIFEYRIRDGR